MTTRYHGLAASLCVLAMATTAHAQITDMKKGEGGSAVQGSAGPSGAQKFRALRSVCTMRSLCVFRWRSAVVASRETSASATSV